MFHRVSLFGRGKRKGAQQPDPHTREPEPLALDINVEDHSVQKAPNEAHKEYLEKRLRRKWECKFPGHDICVLMPDGGHYQVSEEDLAAWLEALCIGDATTTQPPESVLESMRNEPTLDLSDSASSTRGESQTTFWSSMSSLSSNVSGQASISGKAIKWFGQKSLNALETIILAKRSNHHLSFLTSLRKGKFRGNQIEMEKELVGAVEDALEMSRACYSTQVNKAASKIARGVNAWCSSVAVTKQTASLLSRLRVGLSPLVLGDHVHDPTSNHLAEELLSALAGVPLALQGSETTSIVIRIIARALVNPTHASKAQSLTRGLAEIIQATIHVRPLTPNEIDTVRAIAERRMANGNDKSQPPQVWEIVLFTLCASQVPSASSLTPATQQGTSGEGAKHSGPDSGSYLPSRQQPEKSLSSNVSKSFNGSLNTPSSPILDAEIVVDLPGQIVPFSIQTIGPPVPEPMSTNRPKFDFDKVPNLSGHIVIQQGPLCGGGFCDIYLGELQSEQASGPVAMKMLRVFSREAHMAKIKRKFRREVRLWCLLRHRHVLPFYGICDFDESRLFMVSPWAEGGNSLEYLQRNPSTDRSRLLWQTASALEYLHSGQDVPQIVHGDLKADNVLISGAGDALLCDFGLSLFVEEVFTKTGGSSGGLIGGQPRFMAPELLVDPKDPERTSRPTPESDVFAFGSLMLQIYTEQPPFCDLMEMQAIFKVINGEHPSRPTEPTVLERGCDDHVWNIMTDCWEYEPERRPTIKKVRGRIDGQGENLL